MAPKKPKDTTLDENYWRTCIEDAPLNEEFWNVKVILIEAAGNDQDRIYLSKFETFAAEERRFVIKNICKTETIFMVNQLGGEKKVKDESLRVFEEGQMFLKDKKDIPADILALIIKYLILKMKDEYLFIKRQKLEVREGLRRESATMINKAEVKGTVNANLPEEEKIQELPSKDKNKKDELPLQQNIEQAEGKKYNTILRVRGEEWRDKTYVDDFPTDGPNLYVAVTGFTEPYLVGTLLKIGVPLTAVVQIRINPAKVKVPSGLLRPSKRGHSQTEILTAKSQKFWEDLQELRININTCDVYKNTVFIVFSPPYWEAENLSGISEKIYDELCYLMYDIQDLTRQHNHYLDNMEVINIPVETGNGQSQKYYKEHIAEMPLECVTIYSVLDSMLEAVCNNVHSEENSSTTSLSTAITLNQQSSKVENKLEKAEVLVKDVFNILCNSDSVKKTYRVTYGEEYERHRDPTVINYGDFAKQKVFQLGNINMENIVTSMLHGIPIFTLWKNQPRQSRALEAKLNFHVNVLLSCFERKDVETDELNRLIHILACRKMYNNRSSLKIQHLLPSTLTEFKKVFLKRTVLAEPLPINAASYRSWSSISSTFGPTSQKDNKFDNFDQNSETSRIKFLFDCPDISELVSAAEIASNMPLGHIIDNFEFFEEFSHGSAFQTLVHAFNMFNCVDYKYCEVTDSIIFMFFNSHDVDGISREEWRCHLPTPLCLQDFFDFVLEEHYEWIKKEEELYTVNNNQISQSVKNISDVLAEKDCIANTEVNADLLMEGSIKYQDFVEEEAQPENTEFKTKSTTVSPSTTDMTSKSSKKTKSAVSTPKSAKQSVFVADSSSSVKLSYKPFSGYNLSDRRVEIFGKDSCFFSRDGTNVLTKYTIMIPGNSEYIVLKIAPGNGNTEFWMHKALGDVQSHILDMCESFRINSRDNVIIYVQKQSYSVPLPMLDLSCPERLTEKEKITKSSPHNDSFSKLQLMEYKSFHSLNVTWPNGLITETVHEDNSDQISHIKQFYITPTKSDEDMRCISLNGDVIIFKSLGPIEVLRPNGSCITINKCEKKIIQETFEDLESDTSSDKTKKGKGKEKTKPSKASSKTSKNIIDNDDKISDIKLPEYELIIDEFETIEANGLKQKWVNEIPLDTKKLLIRTATDFCSGEVFSRRMDGTSILLNKDGVQIITFPDNTRIITTFIIDDNEIYPEWTKDEIEYFSMLHSDSVDSDSIKSKSTSSQQSYETMNRHSRSEQSTILKKIEDDEYPVDTKKIEQNDGYVSVHISYTIEHKNFATITVNRADGMISLMSPNNVKVTMNSDNSFNFILDNVTTAEFNGQDLFINYKACSECDSNTSCKVKIKYDEIPSTTNFQKCWVKMEDSFSKKISVNDEGSINIIEESHSDEVAYGERANNESKDEYKCHKAKSENSLGKCRTLYEAMSMRFFILRRELTCSELVHRDLVEQYTQGCRWQPWCSINQYHTFGDNRSILSILTPVHLTETEKWLMDSQFANKPKYLTYKHLEEDTGKGFYHWMRPYGRFQPTYMKPENVIPDRLPRAFVLRNLEQQWDDANRENLKGGKELLTAILRYRSRMESDSDTILYVPIRDLRPEDERAVDDTIQAIANTIYEDLKYRVAEDVQKRAKPTITTKPLIPTEELSIEGELEELPDELTTLEDKHISVLKEVEAAEEMSPNLKRYWRRRAEEHKEEQFYKYLLREGSVPPYFRNVLGGAIWWELNNVAYESTIKAERRKMKCVCEEPGETSSLGDVTDPPITQ